MVASRWVLGIANATSSGIPPCVASAMAIHSQYAAEPVKASTAARRPALPPRLLH